MHGSSSMRRSVISNRSACCPRERISLRQRVLQLTQRVSSRNQTRQASLTRSSPASKNTGFGAASSPAERCGLIDGVALERVHGAVRQENAGQPLAVIQDKVLELI